MKVAYIKKNIAVGQPVALIVAKVTKIGEVKQLDDGSTNQFITLTDDDNEEIRAVLKSRDAFLTKDINKSFEFKCVSAGGSKYTGIILKEGNKGLMLSITKSAIIKEIHDEPEEEVKEEREVTSEPVNESTAVSDDRESLSKHTRSSNHSQADVEIRKMFKERLYVLNYLRELNDTLPAEHRYPIEKLPELTTSIWMDVRKFNILQGKEAAKKEVEKKEPEKKEAPVSQSTEKSIDWRISRNPTTGIKLGELRREEAIKMYLVFFYREHKKIEDEGLVEKVKFVRAVGEMLKEYKLGIADAIFRAISNAAPDIIDDKHARMRFASYLKATKVKETEVTREYMEELLADKEQLKKIAHYGTTAARGAKEDS